MVSEKESGYVNFATFVADTGATSHMVKSRKHLTDIIQISSAITMGNEELFQCTDKGIYRGFFKNKHGQDFPIVLQDSSKLDINHKMHYKTGCSIHS